MHWFTCLTFSLIRNTLGVSAKTCAGSGQCSAVPLLREGSCIGVMAMTRPTPRPFTDKQIELVTTFADQAVIAIENTRLFEEVQARTRELTEALEQQTATSEVLSVISSSQGELEPVFHAMLENAVRICDAKFGNLWLCEGDSFRLVTAHNAPAAWAERWQRDAVIRPGPGTGLGRVARTKQLVHINDVTKEPAYLERDPLFVAQVELAGGRTLLVVPMLKDDELIGAIGIYRQEVRPFSDRQIELLKSFANQAVIAIENTRLLNELRESLQQQTATADVLNVISRSKFDRQPVFDAIVASGLKLFTGDAVLITLPEGDVIKAAAVAASDPVRADAIVNRFPVPLTRDYMHGIAILDQRVIDIPDAANAPPELIAGAVTMLPSGNRAITIVPLMRGESAIGALSVLRLVPGSLTPNQFGLLETFADQAVIAIENTRLFEEVQARNRDLSEALEQQTATSEVLKVIGRSTFDLQPVLETLVENATRLCGADTGVIFRLDGDSFRWVADYGATASHREYRQRNPVRAGPGSSMGRAALSGQTVHIVDATADPDFEHTEEAQGIGNFRTLLGVPMLRGGVLLGVFSLQRREVQPFTKKQIELVETFADQAVIAIENVRLLEEAQTRTRELGRSVQELQALGEVGRAVSSTLDLKVVLKTIVDRAVHLSGTDAGSILYYREDTGKFELGETVGLDEQVVDKLRTLDISATEGGLAEALAKRQPLPVADLIGRPTDPLRDAVVAAGFRASLIVPLLAAEGPPLGALILRRRRPGQFSDPIINLMQSFADQSVIALENARLFDEIAHKSRELEIASQHKSQFVANMSHELRTPLAAILGYAELMQEGFYEPLGQKSMDALTRIRSNGKHLLGLINTVLDIAKIESGPVQPEPRRVRRGKRGRDGARRDRVAGRDQEARAQDRCCQEVCRSASATSSASRRCSSTSSATPSSSPTLARCASPQPLRTATSLLR